MKTDAETIRDLHIRVRTLEKAFAGGGMAGEHVPIVAAGMEIREPNEEASRVHEVFAGAFSRQQLALLLAIVKRPIATYEYLDNVTEDHGKYNRYEGEMHQALRTKVTVWKMRQLLKPYGIEIKTWRGIGYYLDDENKAKLKALMEKKDGLP